MRKIIPAVIIVLFVLGFVAFSKLGGVVKTIIETAGTQAVGTAVHVSGLDISIADKTASMSGLSVANPPGFKTNNILKTKSISVTLGDITAKTLTIKEIVVDGTVITFELGPHGANFDALRKNLKSAPSGNNGGSGGGEKSGFDVIIQQLRIVHAQVIPAVPGFSGTVNLPDIVLNNIGTKGNPATPVQVATQIMNRVLATSSSAVMQSGLMSALPKGAAVDNAKNALKDLLSK